MGTIQFGTPREHNAFRILLMGSGELGKEFAIEAMRLGAEVIAVDSYADAPAMQVAHTSGVIDMQDGQAVRQLVESMDPDAIVPEIEAIATDTLIELEEEGFNVIPTARATRLTMDREYIRRVVAEDLGLPTSPYAFADDLESFKTAVQEVGFPCVVKPVMSSSGKGQSTLQAPEDVEPGWEEAISGSRGQSTRVIVEGFVEFETEITLLTVRHADGTTFCPPVAHTQADGDYRESWQPAGLDPEVLSTCKSMTKAVTDELGGVGIFGVELFIDGDDVYFSELSPRPHDTGMVTMISQDLSEFALHARAVLGLAIPDEIELISPAASAVVLADSEGDNPTYRIDSQPLRTPGTDLRIFGKPSMYPGRRMGVGLGRGDDADSARALARSVAEGVEVSGD
jgi:phosphoribosylglycinamide formyltransferase 2